MSSTIHLKEFGLKRLILLPFLALTLCAQTAVAPQAAKQCFDLFGLGIVTICIDVADPPIIISGEIEK